MCDGFGLYSTCDAVIVALYFVFILFATLLDLFASSVRHSDFRGLIKYWNWTLEQFA